MHPSSDPLSYGVLCFNQRFKIHHWVASQSPDMASVDVLSTELFYQEVDKYIVRSSANMVGHLNFTQQVWEPIVSPLSTALVFSK